jgi:hypothetical protein
MLELLLRRRHRAAVMGGSPFPHPGPVFQVLGTAHWSLMPLLGPRTLPVVGFGMTIGEGKTTAAVMIGSWYIKPLRMFHPEGKCRIVEVVYIFIHENPEQRRPRRTNGGEFAVGEPR